jgi:histidinol-phosphate aminotransferase
MKVSSEIENLIPYVPGKPIEEVQREYNIQKVCKLASNENPLGTSPKALAAIKDYLQNGLHIYPDAASYQLIQALAKKLDVAPKELALGNGSNEIIDLLIRVYCPPKSAILVSEHSFIAYSICAQAQRVHCIHVPSGPGLVTDLEAMNQRLEEDTDFRIKLVFIANPNNPTGTLSAKNEMAKFLALWGNHPERLIILDEAYHEYVNSSDYVSGSEWRKSYSQVITLRTFSKIYGMAGLRLGYMIAPADVVSYFNRVRTPFNINTVAQVAGIAALSDQEFVNHSVQINTSGMEQVCKALKELNLSFLKSFGNFVFFDSAIDSQILNQHLLKKGLVIRPLKNYGFQTQFRMSIGTADENNFAIKILEEAMSLCR